MITKIGSIASKTSGAFILYFVSMGLFKILMLPWGTTVTPISAGETLFELGFMIFLLPLGIYMFFPSHRGDVPNEYTKASKQLCFFVILGFAVMFGSVFIS